jgi:hypothetical protein
MTTTATCKTRDEVSATYEGSLWRRLSAFVVIAFILGGIWIYLSGAFLLVLHGYKGYDSEFLTYYNAWRQYDAMPLSVGGKLFLVGVVTLCVVSSPVFLIMGRCGRDGWQGIFNVVVLGVAVILAGFLMSAVLA